MIDPLEVSMVEVLIQVEAGSCNKKLYNEKTLEFKAVSQVSRPYPYPYGFIVGTSSADGDCVDCYLITKELLKSGTIVECEPVSLLEQEEDGEIDHKVLAALTGQDVEITQALLEELSDFIYAVFAGFPEVHVRIGKILPREAALQHIEEFRVS
jgi:inorganic pyrophosphatase